MYQRLFGVILLKGWHVLQESQKPNLYSIEITPRAR